MELLRTKFRTWRWKVNIYHLLLLEQEVEVLSRIHEDEHLTDGATENSGRIVLERKSWVIIAFFISPSIQYDLVLTIFIW